MRVEFEDFVPFLPVDTPPYDDDSVRLVVEADLVLADGKVFSARNGAEIAIQPGNPD